MGLSIPSSPKRGAALLRGGVPFPGAPAGGQEHQPPIERGNGIKPRAVSRQRGRQDRSLRSSYSGGRSHIPASG
jgi:hypothetical protein